MSVNWDSGHCYCECDDCMEGDTSDCNATLICVPPLINELTGEHSVVACDTCPYDHSVENIESFIQLAEENDSGKWYHTDLLRKWVLTQQLPKMMNK
jgi:hypothetical protein